MSIDDIVYDIVPFVGEQLILVTFADFVLSYDLHCTLKLVYCKTLIFRVHLISRVA